VPSVKPTASQPTSCSVTTLLTWSTAEWTRYARRGVSPPVRADRILVLPGWVPEPLSASGGGTSPSVRPGGTAPAGSADPGAVASRFAAAIWSSGRCAVFLLGSLTGSPASAAGLLSPVSGNLSPVCCRSAGCAMPSKRVKIDHRRRLLAIRYAGIFRSWWQAVCTGSPETGPGPWPIQAAHPGSRPRPPAPDPAAALNPGLGTKSGSIRRRTYLRHATNSPVFAPYRRVLHGGLTGSLTAQERRKGSPQ
jgi:hypothetical protein